MAVTSAKDVAAPLFGIENLLLLIQPFQSLDCREDDLEYHMEDCQPALTFPENFLSSIPHRLLHSSMRFCNIYHSRVAIAGLHGFFRQLDIFPDLRNESPDSFVTRFYTMSHQSIWVITLQEKQHILRTETPGVKDVHYVANSGRLIRQSDFPRRDVELKHLHINRENIYSPLGTNVIIGIFINDKDGIGQADYSLSIPVPNIAPLQFAFLGPDPEKCLVSTGM
ncbi:hypothetical protein VNI00_011202 [Paramarasmius palmivorus]|uniref:Uncharacterized protein n=1 Tax=Paramarasmius palmivorus TaxID=297713 RepID=A0AAW0CGH7_9AGAR